MKLSPLPAPPLLSPLPSRLLERFVTPNAMVFGARSRAAGRARARSLHAFVRAHWVHPDDIAFERSTRGRRPASAVRPRRGRAAGPGARRAHAHAKRKRPRARRAARRRLGEGDEERRRRRRAGAAVRGRAPARRLGMAGGHGWHMLRSHAAMWILYYFGGFARSPTCWINARSADSAGPFLPDKLHLACEPPPVAAAGG